MSTGHIKTWDDFQAHHKAGVSSLKSTSWPGFHTIHMSARALFDRSTLKACKYRPRDCAGLAGTVQAGNRAHWTWLYRQHCQIVQTVACEIGRPRYSIDEQRLTERLEINLPVQCIAKLLGVSAPSIAEWKNFSSLLAALQQHHRPGAGRKSSTNKSWNATAGYRMVKGRLKSLGIHVQWRRVAAHQCTELSHSGLVIQGITFWQHQPVQRTEKKTSTY